MDKQGFRFIGDIPAFPFDPLNPSCPLEIIIKGMEPFMRQCPSPTSLCQIDNNLTRFVMCRGSTATPCAESHTQFAIERYCLWRDIQNTGQVHECVIGIVNHPLSFFSILP